MGRELQIKRITTAKGVQFRYPFKGMEVGDWFLVPESAKTGLRGAATNYSRRWGWRFSTIKHAPGTYICRRVEPKGFDMDVVDHAATYHIPPNGIADPERMRERCIYPFAMMHPGDWFMVPIKFRSKIQQACVKHNNTGHFKMKTSTDFRHGASPGNVIVLCVERARQ